jgi:hypothetical protein
MTRRSGLLYVTSHCVTLRDGVPRAAAHLVSLSVETSRERFAAHVDPAFGTWLLIQKACSDSERAEASAAEEEEDHGVDEEEEEEGEGEDGEARAAAEVGAAAVGHEARDDGDDDAARRSRRALRLLMHCRVVDVFARVASFAFAG